VNAEILPSIVERMERSPLTSGAEPRALVPTNFEGVFRLATVLAQSGLAPRDLNTPEKISVAIMHGLEVGMTPMAALQSIAVVNGRPTIWGDGAIGLVRASGQMEWIEETVEGDGHQMVAKCKVKRRGEPKAAEGTFSVADAKTAGLWDKPGPWKQYPKRMLKMRARAFVLRDAFADVLRGLAIREEMEDVERAAVDVTPAPPPPAARQRRAPAPQVIEHQNAPAAPSPTDAAVATGAEAPRHTRGPDQAVEEASAPNVRPANACEAGRLEPIRDVVEEEPFDPDAKLAELKDQLATAQSEQDVEEIRALFADDLEVLPRSHRSQADDAFQEAEERLKPKAPTWTLPEDIWAVPDTFPSQTEYWTFLERAVKGSVVGDREKLIALWQNSTLQRDALKFNAQTQETMKQLVAKRLDEITPAPEPEPAQQEAASDAFDPLKPAMDEESYSHWVEWIVANVDDSQRLEKLWQGSADWKDQFGASMPKRTEWRQRYLARRKELQAAGK